MRPHMTEDFSRCVVVRMRLVSIQYCHKASINRSLRQNKDEIIGFA